MNPTDIIRQLQAERATRLQAILDAIQKAIRNPPDPAPAPPVSEKTISE